MNMSVESCLLQSKRKVFHDRTFHSRLQDIRKLCKVETWDPHAWA